MSIWCGTSVGAINAVTLASLAHLPADEQVQQAVALWEGLRKQDVLAPLVGIGGVRMVLRLVGHTLGLPGVGLASVLDPSPLAGSLDRWIDWRRLEHNMGAGHADAVCVVATMLSTGKPVGFVTTDRQVPSHAGNEIRYVKTRLRSEHIRASAAIPVPFPTVEVTTPRAARGHYTDGGTRFNSPIKPAVDLGADKVIVIGFEPFGRAPEQPTAAHRQPSIADVAANVLDGLLVDQVAHDLRRVAAINSFFVENHSSGPIGSPRTYRIAPVRGRRDPPHPAEPARSPTTPSATATHSGSAPKNRPCASTPSSTPPRPSPATSSVCAQHPRSPRASPSPGTSTTWSPACCTRSSPLAAEEIEPFHNPNHREEYQTP